MSFPEDGGCRFLRKVVNDLQDFTVASTEMNVFYVVTLCS
jgi:hypothetical protein